MSDFGSMLRRLREQKGLSLTQLASATNYSKGYLSRLEKGDRAPKVVTARVCDSVLEADGQLLATILENEEARAEQVQALDLLPAPVTTAEHRRDWFRSGVDVYEGQLETIFKSIREMGHCMSPDLILPMVLTNIESARHVLESATPGNTKKVLLLIARLQEYAGWMAQEAGQMDLAVRLTEEAGRMAADAGNPDMAQFALVRHADFALYQGDGLKIVQLTSNILDQREIELRTRSIAWQRQAQGYALLGDRSGCMRALDSARTFHEADQAELGVQALGTTSVARPIEMTKGWALVDLCFYEEAAKELREVISELPSKSVRSRVRFTARMALAHAFHGDVERACEAVRAVLPDIHSVDSDTVRVDLRALAEVLRRRWPRSVLVGDLLAALRPQLGGSARLG